MCPVERKKNGLQVTGSPLFLDATRKVPISFVSHAHSDHIARHERTIATSSTLKFMAKRLGTLPAPLAAPYHRPFELGALHLELLPAGHILGSAQLRVIRADGERIVFTGDLNLRPSLTAEAAEVAECDTLVIESTFGHPRFRFPPRDEVLANVEEWVRRTLDAGEVPLLLAYALGKSQEAMKFLASRGFPLVAHKSIFEMSELYAECGMPIEGLKEFRGHVQPGEVLFAPPTAMRTRAMAAVFPRRTAVLTGWAMDATIVRRYGADVAFPLSDHADCESLIDYAKATGAQQVITHHGYAHELAEEMRKQGIDARALGTIQQLQLL